jgi:nicotinamide-nucleotide amidase
MISEIITIGDELLIGQVVNTNQAYIAEKLNTIGVSVERMTTVGDDMQAILDAYDAAWKCNDIVIVTGGLGPTHDDITKKAVCTFFDSDLVPNDEIRKHIEGLVKKWNRQWSPSYEEQTMFPRKATLIPNPIGTAGGMLFRVPSGKEQEKYFFVLPGVPYEMKAMIDQTIIPFLSARVSSVVIRHRTLRTTGISESLLAAQLGNIEDIVQGAKLAFLPSTTGVRMRITVRARDAVSADTLVGEVEQRVRAKVQRHIFGVDDEELEEVVGKILREKNLTLAIAESCTGGFVANKITDVSGSSNYFLQGIVAYSNESKVELLGINEELIQRHGAVSKEVAEAMAQGVRRVAGTDIGISTTGIAGPTGATETKPVGLVWVGYSDKETTLAVKFNLGDGRKRVKERATQAALEVLRRKLLKIE